MVDAILYDMMGHLVSSMNEIWLEAFRIKTSSQAPSYARRLQSETLPTYLLTYSQAYLIFVTTITTAGCVKFLLSVIFSIVNVDELL